MGFGDMTAGMGSKMLFAGQATTKPVLTVEPVPISTWAKNLRSMLPKETWDVLRRAAYKKARYKCEICGGRGPKWPVECHEQWQYNQASAEQKLVKLIALCPSCHAVKHWGYSKIQGREAECLDHLLFVNGWTAEQAEQHLARADEEWKMRSRVKWDVDLSVLYKYGIDREQLIELFKAKAGKAFSQEECGPEEEPWDGRGEELWKL